MEPYENVYFKSPKVRILRNRVLSTQLWYLHIIENIYDLKTLLFRKNPLISVPIYES